MFTKFRFLTGDYFSIGTCGFSTENLSRLNLNKRLAGKGEELENGEC